MSLGAGPGRWGLTRSARVGLVTGLLLLAASSPTSAQVELPNAKPVPRMQVIPLPDDRASIRRDGEELTCYHFGPTLRRPFLFPINGASGRSLTRMGHPRDPISHSHHNSVWVSHNDVGGEDFWGDQGPGRIAHRRIIRYDDGDDAARIVSLNAWIGTGDRVLITDRRGVTVRPLSETDWLLILDLQMEAGNVPVTLGKTAFGPVGVRMAKTLGVNDGGGTIRNSEGNVDETGPNGAFRKRARWVDYTGPITRDAAEGVALFDHPANPNHPSAFHVRNDGWMGPSLTLDVPITIEPSKPLRLRYGLFVHRGVPRPEAIESQWKEFARSAVEELPAK